MESFRHCRTLILDPEILVCSSLQETLKLLGFRMILTASRVDTAYLLVREACCDLVLLHWPSDRFFLRALRTEYGRDSPIIVAMGSDKGPRHLLSVIREGADAFINTPVSNAQMLITMKRLLMDFTPPVRSRKPASGTSTPDTCQSEPFHECDGPFAHNREGTILHGDFRRG